MKASELIDVLQHLIDKHGDFELYEASWNTYDAIYTGLCPCYISMSFYNREQLKEKEAFNTEGLVNELRHPDRHIYDKMDDKSVVCIVNR